MKKIILIAVALFFVSALVAALWETAPWIIVLVVLAILAAVIIPRALKAKKAKIPETTPQQEPSDEVAPPVQVFDYSYTGVGLYRPAGVAEMPKLGDALLLELDPDNPYDGEAVRAVQWTDAGPKVYGYMNKGKLRDMVTDFLNRGNTVATKVTRADDKLEIWIGMDK